MKGSTSTRTVDADHTYGSNGTSTIYPGSFDVWAWTVGRAAGEILYMGDANDGIKIKKATTSTEATGIGWKEQNANSLYWGYDKAGEVTYWPAEKLRFFAVAPAFGWTKGCTATTPAADPITKNPKFGEATGGYFDCKVTDDNMDDVLVGLIDQKATIGTSTSYNVNLQFKHALAKVNFLGKLDPNVNTNLRLQIYSIEVCNILSEGTCFIPSQAWDTSTIPVYTGAATVYNDYSSGAIQWGNLSGTTFTANVNSGTDHTNHLKTWASYQLSGSKNIGYKDIGTADPYTTEWKETVNGVADVKFYNEVNFGSIVVIPQYITSWKNKAMSGTETAAAAAANAATSVGTYIHIQYTLVSQNDVKILDGTGENKVDAYVPLPADIAWQPGYSYTYTLLFGLGNKADGTTLGAPITFSVDITSWSNQTATNINLAN
jgi:hypothetical protein